MKLNALIKGMKLNNGWIHEDGLVIINKAIYDRENKKSLFLVYNVDTVEYGFVEETDILFYDNEMRNMEPVVEVNKLFDDNYAISIYDVMSIDDSLITLSLDLIESNMMNEKAEEELESIMNMIDSYTYDLYENGNIDDIFEFDDNYECECKDCLNLNTETPQTNEFLEFDLEELAYLIDNGWDDSELSKFIQKQIRPEDNENI